jgi:hypothetical protein
MLGYIYCSYHLALWGQSKCLYVKYIKIKYAISDYKNTTNKREI